MVDGSKELRRIVRMAADICAPYRIDRGGKFRLADHDPGATGQSEQNVTHCQATDDRARVVVQH